MRRAITDVFFVLLVLAVAATPQAQELAPRAYWPAPTGTNVAVMSYQHSQGDVLVDASAPIEGAEATLDFLSLTYQRTFGLFDRTASLQINYPFVQGDAEAMINGEFRERSISAGADARARLAINLMGAPSMDGKAFRELVANPEPIVGASVLVSARRWALLSQSATVGYLRAKLALGFMKITMIIRAKSVAKSLCFRPSFIWCMWLKTVPGSR